MQHLCMDCADAEELSESRAMRRIPRRLRRVEIGAVLVVLGLFTLGLSALADVLQFGSSEGFGWRQGIGLLLAGFLVFSGLLFRALVFMVIGLSIGLLTLLADALAFGSSPGFGCQQVFGSFLGAGIAFLGGCVLRRPNESEGAPP